MNYIDNQLNILINEELNNSNINKYISKVHPDMDLKYNSLNIAVGKPGTSKTTTFMKTMIKLCQYPNSYHLILYVSNIDSDDTINSLKKYVSIPMLHVSYNDFLDRFEKLIETKQAYWNAIRNNDINQIYNLSNVLYLNNPVKNIQTMILCDDAGWLFTKKSPMLVHFSKLRHYQCSFWLNIQI